MRIAIIITMTVIGVICSLGVIAEKDKDRCKYLALVATAAFAGLVIVSIFGG